jgi:hypothetical protein
VKEKASGDCLARAIVGDTEKLLEASSVLELVSETEKVLDDWLEWV